MENELHFDKAAEKEATDIGSKFMDSSDVVGDMSRAFGRDLSDVHIHTEESAARDAAERGVDAFSTGNDIFFARGAFDQSDPASRGLLAHELSHSMQQGVGGEGDAMTQSAPMGSAQGGLLDWFKGIIGKSGEEAETGAAVPQQEEAAPETGAQPEPAPNNAPQEEPGPAAPEQELAGADAQPQLMQNNDPQKELRGAAEELRTFKKHELPWNYVKYKRVTDAIDASIERLYTRLSGNPAEDQAILDDVVSSFDDLIRACEDYLSRDPNTSKGWHRREIVRQVLNIAVKDRVGFVMQAPDGMKRYSTAMDILVSSRQRKLQLVDKNEADLQHVGNAASYIAKIEKGMLKDPDASGFFKEDETYTRIDDPVTFKLGALETVKEKLSLSDTQYNALKTAIVTVIDARHAAGYNEDRKIHEAATLVERLYSVDNTVAGNIPNPLERGQSLNLSKRNVATSRLAELLGVGDLIAKSETATLVDADGTSRSGNLMQAARGQEVTGMVVEQFRDQYAARRKNYAQDRDVALEGSLDDKVTPEFLQSLTSLQVLDNLAAQQDRHAGNYFAENVDGKLGRVQGIDNDFSFTNDTLDWQSNFNNFGSHGKHILNKQGEMAIPYMDRSLADRITALDESVLRDVMADILEPWAIDALCTRFNQIKTAIQKDQENNPGMERYLKKTSDWARPEVLDTLKNGVEKPGSFRNTTNYVSNFLLATDLDGASSLDLRASLESDLGDRLVSEVLEQAKTMGDPEKAKAFLKSYGVKDEILSYLQTTGQLLDGSALMKRLPGKEIKDPIFGAISDQWAREMAEKKKQG